MSMETVITDNFMFIFYAIVVIIVLAIIAHMLNTREREKSRKEVADMMFKTKKLEMIEKEKYIEQLKNASMVLRDDEKTRIDEIVHDKAVLSRRSLALMNEVEERMQRLERGADNAKLLKTLKEIKDAERELFGGEGGY